MDNNLGFQPAPGAITKRVRRARGNASGLGGEAGRGHKGQKSRSGYSRRFGFEGGQTSLLRSAPKRKGFKALSRQTVSLVFLDQIDQRADLSTVTHATLQAAGLCDQHVPKILMRGAINRVVTIQGVAVSRPVREAIIAAGGAVID